MIFDVEKVKRNGLKELLKDFKSTVKSFICKKYTEYLFMLPQTWTKGMNFEFYFDIMLSFCGF